MIIWRPEATGKNRNTTDTAKAGTPEIVEERMMSTMYESLMEGLQEDLKDIQTYGESQGRKTVIEYIPVKEYTADEVKSIRKGVGVSQSAFAKCLGVSKKTVEKWESGDNIPSGPASRLLDLFFNHTISTAQYIKHV